MLWLLYGSATAPLRGNCLPCSISCQTDQPRLGCRGEKEAVPWLWDVLSTPCPMEEAEKRGKGERWDENILSPVKSCPGWANITSACRRVCEHFPKRK